MLYSDMGVNSIGLAIFTTTGLEQRNPDLVRRFVAATQESFERGAQQPDAAIKALITEKPTLDPALSLAQLRTGLPLMKSSYGPERPVGWMATEDWASTIALMKEFQGLETDLPASAFWTDAFMPQ
jgi:NitT/TauT family transport system substrate-binding protein